MLYKEDDNINMAAIDEFRKLSAEEREKMIAEQENAIRKQLNK